MRLIDLDRCRLGADEVEGFLETPSGSVAGAIAWWCMWSGEAPAWKLFVGGGSAGPGPGPGPTAPLGGEAMGDRLEGEPVLVDIAFVGLVTDGAEIPPASGSSMLADLPSQMLSLNRNVGHVMRCDLQEELAAWYGFVRKISEKPLVIEFSGSCLRGFGDSAPFRTWDVASGSDVDDNEENFLTLPLQIREEAVISEYFKTIECIRA